ncbi:MAG TPA: hypothetical protein VLB68_15460, partial [Pyrinomonadaceae bacterium]|nr:hypothetical protein [Pyrinomonadaceae bacterium]
SSQHKKSAGIYLSVTGWEVAPLIPKRRRKRSAGFNAHSFIVKVWVEEEVNKYYNPIWHGHITHVPGGEQRYLRSLSEIEVFIEPYLSAMGIRFGLCERIRRWLSFRNNK